MTVQYQHNRGRVTPLRRVRSRPRLLACSVCLRVQQRGKWIEADEAIRRLRTFEIEQVVRLGGGLCERCEAELRLRRLREPPVAA